MSVVILCILCKCFIIKTYLYESSNKLKIEVIVLMYLGEN